MTPRVLVCVTVYNGREFVPRTIRSIEHLNTDGLDLDVLVLDDHSPDRGWSAELAQLCREAGFDYYCSPRNLGIPRNVNLGLSLAVRAGYDYVLICNSDIILPADGVRDLVRCHRSDPSIGSITALSNNVSMYSLPNLDPDHYLAEQPIVDWVSSGLAGAFGDAVLDVPAGISFCMLIPTAAISDIGVMDPIFGRGYCEETDFTLRSRQAGYRIGLAPGVFVYHQGGGSNVEAGLVAAGMTTVPENEAIIDLRYPQFRSQVSAFGSSGLLDTMHADAIGKIVLEAGRQFGYRVNIGWVSAPPHRTEVICQVIPDARPEVLISAIGFTHRLPIRPGADISTLLRDFFGGPPASVSIESMAGRSVSWADDQVPATGRLSYPSRV